MLSFVHSHGLEIHTESLLSQFPRAVSKGCAISVSKCRSSFPLSGLWYYVIENRFCVSAAILAPQTALFQWQAEDKRLKPEAKEQGSYIFVATLFGETGHLCPTPAQHHGSIILWEERGIKSGVTCVMVWGWIMLAATEIWGRSPSRGISFIYYEKTAFSSPSVLYILWTSS